MAEPMQLFFRRILRLLLWLTERSYDVDVEVDIDVDIDVENDKRPIYIIIRRRKPKAIWTLRYKNEVIFRGENIMAVLNEGQVIDASVKFTGKDGKEAKYQEGSVVWSSSDPSVASVEADPADEKKAKIRGVNGADNGSVVIECRADGDPDEAVRELISTADVSVTDPDGGEAFFSELTLGEPYDEASGGDGGDGSGEENPDNLPHPDQTLPGDLPE